LEEGIYHGINIYSIAYLKDKKEFIQPKKMDCYMIMLNLIYI